MNSECCISPLQKKKQTLKTFPWVFVVVEQNFGVCSNSDFCLVAVEDTSQEQQEQNALAFLTLSRPHPSGWPFVPSSLLTLYPAPPPGPFSNAFVSHISF